MKNEKNCWKKDISDTDKAIYLLARTVDNLIERIETIEGYLYDEDDVDEDSEDEEDDPNDPYFWDENEDWTSVKEELPDEFGEYLVTIKDTIKEGEKEYEYRGVTISQYNPKRCEWDKKNVIAWQELSHTYNGE